MSVPFREAKTPGTPETGEYVASKVNAELSELQRPLWALDQVRPLKAGGNNSRDRTGL